MPECDFKIANLLFAKYIRVSFIDRLYAYVYNLKREVTKRKNRKREGKDSKSELYEKRELELILFLPSPTTHIPL